MVNQLHTIYSVLSIYISSREDDVKGTLLSFAPMNKTCKSAHQCLSPVLLDVYRRHEKRTLGQVLDFLMDLYDNLHDIHQKSLDSHQYRRSLLGYRISSNKDHYRGVIAKVHTNIKQIIDVADRSFNRTVSYTCFNIYDSFLSFESEYYNNNCSWYGYYTQQELRMLCRDIASSICIIIQQTI
jgi:hypothetical protein